MKKVIVIFLLIFMAVNISSISYASEPSIVGEAAILIDANTGEILYEKNIHKQMYPASTTKIMTGILAIENGSFDDKIIIDKETTLGIDGSHIALEPGEILSQKDILHALLIESANDSAVALARHISGSVEEFANLMNEKAKEIGAKNTHFTNPNGLPDENHVTTAYDLAMIAKYAMQNETFRDIVKEYKYTIEPTNKKTEPRYLKSSNRLLYGTGSGNQINVDGKWIDIKYPDADGIKTGYTIAAQNCLVSSATRGNTQLISVVLKSNGLEVFGDTHKLLNYGFNNFEYTKIVSKNQFVQNIDVEYGDKKLAAGIIGQSLYATIPKGREDDIESKIILPENLQAPISKNQVLGRVEYNLDGKLIGSTNIISTVEINQKGIYKVVESTQESFIVKNWWIIPLVLFLLWRTSVAYRRHKKRKSRRKSLTFSYNNKSKKFF